MTIYYSETAGFRDSELHGQVPSDAVEVTAEDREALLLGEADGGKIRVVDGRAVLVPGDEGAATALALKNAAFVALSESDRVVLRSYERQLDLPASWVEYREALRQIIRGEGLEFPDRPDYPD